MEIYKLAKAGIASVQLEQAAMYIFPLIQKSHQVFVERLNRPSGAVSKKVPPPHNKIVFAKVFAHERFELLFVGARQNRSKIRDQYREAQRRDALFTINPTIRN